MLVINRMTKDPVTVTGDDLLIQARLKMQKGGFRRIPVVSDGQLVGMITDRDLREHAGYLDRTEVKAAMSKKLVTVTPATTVEAAAQLLLKQKIGGLPVVEKGRLVGMITTSDILQAFLDVMGVSKRPAYESILRWKVKGAVWPKPQERFRSREERFSALARIDTNGARHRCATCVFVRAMPIPLPVRSETWARGTGGASRRLITVESTARVT